jgi:hypothetical protein
MPRGYLKHQQRTVGKKKARGGSSRRSSRRKFCSNKLGFSSLPWIEEDFYWPRSGDFGLMPPSRSAEDECGRDLTRSLSPVQQELLSDESSFSLCDSVVETATSSYSLVQFEDDVISLNSFTDCTATFEQPPQLAWATTLTDYSTHEPFFSCPICLELKSSHQLVPLFAGCKHPPACRSCLYTHYISISMDNPSNFPLTCFWPNCQRYLRDTQVQRFIENPNDLQRFYFQEAASKQIKRESRKQTKDARQYHTRQCRRAQKLKVLQPCPRCDQITPVCPGNPASSFSCQSCGFQGAITVMTPHDVKSLIYAPLDSLTLRREAYVDARTMGDLLVNCPSCCTLIQKNGGCTEMCCAICHTDFNFVKAKRCMDY